MIIDDVMPEWDVGSRHEISVHAPVERVYHAIRTADLARHPVVRGLLGLRALPAAIATKGVRRLRGQSRRPVTLAEFERQGFRIVAEAPPRELVIGLEGAFWRPSGELRPITLEAFSTPVPHGVARAVWNFSVVPAGNAEATLVTETRVLTGDISARRRFRMYWLCVGWGSGLIRRLMLQAIKVEAEGSRA